MSAEPENRGVLESLGRTFGRGLVILRNRAELFVVEAQEEKHRLITLFLLAGSALLLGLLALVLFTGVIIFLFAPTCRIYVAAVLGVLYLVAAALLVFRVKTYLHAEPFAETIDQIKKDVECLAPPS